MLLRRCKRMDWIAKENVGDSRSSYSTMCGRFDVCAH